MSVRFDALCKNAVTNVIVVMGVMPNTVESMTYALKRVFLDLYNARNISYLYKVIRPCFALCLDKFMG